MAANQKPDTDERRRASDARPEQLDLTPAWFPRRKDISHTLVIKDRDLFFLTEPDGCVPLEPGHGFGLFYHDCRFLNGYEMRIEGKKPEQLVWSAAGGQTGVIGLTNPEFTNASGLRIGKHSIGIRWTRCVDGAQLALHDVIRIQSLAFDQLSFRFSLTFGASFEDLFEIRGMMRKLRGEVHQPEWRGRCLELGYKGADGIHRSTSIRFSATPVKAGTTCTFDVHLKPNETSEFSVSALIAETPNRTRRRLVKRAKGELNLVDANVNDGWATWLEDGTEVHTNSLSLNGVLKRSFLDLNMLRSYIGNEEYFAAGVPWFVALFGRDSIITALQMLSYDSRIAEHTILLLAALQGRQIDNWRDEEPGKIPHELRVGEMANLKEVPHTPYYGTVDATPLFLILIGRHAAWTGELALFNAVRPNIDAALDWISRSCASSASGYLEYQRTTEAGLANQGWKDSTDAVVNPDGSLASPPIAMVEVQAYVYQAKMEMAALFRLAGEIDRADRLQREADDLKQRFNIDFWGDDGLYALALQNGGTRAAVMSSNAGHALWTGIADPAEGASNS